MPHLELAAKNSTSGPSSNAVAQSLRMPFSGLMSSLISNPSGRQTHQAARKGARLERAQIVDALADADRDDRQLEPLGQRHQHAALGAAVELGHHQRVDRRQALE